jgi:hypothetical protein
MVEGVETWVYYLATNEAVYFTDVLKCRVCNQTCAHNSESKGFDVGLSDTSLETCLLLRSLSSQLLKVTLKGIFVFRECPVCMYLLFFICHSCSSFQTHYSFIAEYHNVEVSILARIRDIVCSVFGSETAFRDYVLSGKC